MSSCNQSSWFATPVHLKPLNGKTYLTLLLPVLVAYFICAMLVAIQGTRSIRLALLPFCLFSVFRVATRLDLPYPGASGLMSMVGWSSMRMIGWALEPDHYVRVGKYRVSSSASGQTRSILDILYDSAELCCNFRGVGWNWSVYRDPITPQSRSSFFWSSLKSWFFLSLVFEACIGAYNILFSPSSPVHDFPLLQRVSESLIFPISVWGNMAGYDLCALFGVFICGQDPASWPPLFKRPWSATSLTDFWGKRWHQGFRDTFSRAGGRPLFYLFGRVGYVLGCFLMSGLFHDGITWGLMGRKQVCCSMTPYFILNGVGVLLEITWRHVTGKKVAGPLGWIWTMTWLVGWLTMTFSSACMDVWYRPLEANMAMRPTYLLTTTLKAVRGISSELDSF